LEEAFSSCSPNVSLTPPPLNCRVRLKRRGVGGWMLLSDGSSSGLYIDIVVVLIICFMFFLETASRRKTQRKIREIEEKIATLVQLQSEMSASLERETAIVKERLVEKTNPLTSKLNELSRQVSLMHERSEAIRRELEQKISPLRAYIDDTAAKFSSSNDALRKIVQQGRNEIERMSKDIDSFAEEIQKMKDIIRERAVDLEL
jgi:hypothetical protein